MNTCILDLFTSLKCRTEIESTKTPSKKNKNFYLVRHFGANDTKRVAGVGGKVKVA